MIVFPVVTGLLALVVVVLMVRSVLAKDQGTAKMAEISHLIQVGARAFLYREYSHVLVVVLVVAVFIGLTPLISPEVTLGWRTSLAFILGAVISAACGYIGMSIATRANARTTQGAVTGGVKGALSVAISGGSVMGLSVVGLGLLGLVAVFIIFHRDPVVVNGYAMGASLVALFARSGGGIYTKGADMGADLVGKVEAGIPEDDPRNPAVIADNVGDNVGDVAGLGADLLESYVESIIAALAIAFSVGMANRALQGTLQMLPLLIASAGIVSSIIGVYYVRFFGRRDPQKSLMWGTYIAAILTAVFSYMIVSRLGMAYGDYGKMGPFWATIAGIVSGIVIGFTSEYFTSSRYRLVRGLAKSAQTGPAVTVNEGTAIGMLSTFVPVIVLAVAVIVSYNLAGPYGVAMAAFGMLATTGMILSVDSYGPIADNAGGIAEMAGLDPSVRKITDNLDAVGNTTAAIGKGFAIGSAAFASMSLITAFLTVAHVAKSDLRSPHVMAGLMIGGMLPFFFASMLFRAVSRVAYGVIEEVRRQFREIKGLMEGKALPDSATCVSIAAKGAIKGMILPGIVIILVPVIVGFAFGPDTLAGILVGALITGLMLGIQMANSGGAMDNAKKYIEEGHFGGKGSPAHAAAVVGDTVGDPLKDTVGPSINILIKLMAVISLVLAPLFV